MGSKCCKCGRSKTISGQRSVSTYATYPKKRSRTRRRMVGNDVEVDDIVEEDRFSEPQWSGTGHPVLARRLADLSVKVGARARFLVEVSSSTPVSVRWEKDGRTVDESDRISMVTEGNFHCLDISPVCQEDGGLWRVKVTNVVGTAMSSAQLTLLVPKAYKKPEFVEPLRAVLTAQGTVSLECKVIGVPTPLLRWFKGNNEIKAGDVLALTPNASDPTSLGTYTCLAANCMGNAESTSIVHIDGAPTTVQGFLPTGPKPIFAKELRNEKVKLGGNVTLECKVTVPPWPEAVNWYGPKGEIVESSRAHLMEDGAGLYSLKVSCVTAEDNGTWKCVATNKHGAKAISTCLISVNYPKNYRKPKFLESLKAVLTEEGLVSFECKVVGYPTPNLSWFKDGQELKPGDVYQLTGTNSLGSYCCIARNCMGEAQSSAELTLEDIKSQLSEEERVQLSSDKLPPRFIAGLKSVEAKINESLRLTVKVSVFPEPTVMWFRDDEVIEDSDRYKIEKDKLGVYHMNISKLEFCDQAEWKCVATNDYGQSVTSSFVKLNIPKHYKKPKFLEDLKAVMSEEGAVNLECKVIGVPQPKLKWFKDGKELKPGDIHKIISGQDGTCCLGTYTCLAQNCMGSVSSSASLLGFEEKGEKSTGAIPETSRNGQVLSRDRSLSTIHEERTSQLHDTDKSTTIDDRAEEVSFSFDGKEVSVSLYETPDLTEEEALQIVEMYADQISEHVTEQNVVELPPMRFTKESSTSGKLVMEAVVIDVSPEYFSSTPAPRKVVEDDLRTDADVDEFSLVEELNTANLSPDRGLSPIENLTLDKINADFAEKLPPSKPPRLKSKAATEEDQSVKDKKTSKKSKKKSTDSEKEDDSLQEFEKRKTQSSLKQTTSERKRTESELEDDSLYEFESRKTKDDVFKSCKEDEPLKYSTETGVPKTSDNESQYYSPIKSPTSVVSKQTEDEATFDTAEDSAFDKSEMSVLETLAHSLHEIQKNLTAVEAQVGSESSTADMKSAQGITEYLAEPLAEVQKNLELVEAQIQEFPSGKYSSDMLETLIQPITKFKKNLALLEEKSLPSILESVAGPLEELNREIAFIQQATQSQIEHAKSVEQVQESLTKIIERQASVPSDRKMMDTIQMELQKLEEKANDDLEVYYDRLLNIGTELRSKANEEQDQEIQDILKAVGDLVKPLKRLTAVTSKTISVIVDDSQSGSVPSKKVVDSLLKPLDALDASLRLLESVGMLRSHKTIRGAGIPILYKVSVPMEELETTIKLVENLSAHSAVEFLIPPLDNLIKVVSDIDVSAGGEGFLEDLQGEGTPLVRNLDDSLDIMLNCIRSIDKGVTMVDSERNIPGQLPSLLKPMEDLQKSLKAVEKGIKSREIGYEEVHAIAQELSKPLQAIRSEFSILQHEIEADHYSSEPNPSQTALTTLVGPLESVQNCISSFHETVLCKSADDPIHLRFVLYSLKELSEPFSSLSGKMIRTEEVLLGKGDPLQGLKAVARSVSELRDSSSALTAESNVIEQISTILSTPLTRVQNGLETILKCVDKKDKQDLNKDLLKSMDDPFKELQSALLRIEGNIHENVIEGVTPELRQAVQELQKRILIIQDQSSFEYGDEPSTIEANVDILQSLTQPLQTLHAQFTEVQRSTNRTLMKADRALTSLKESTRRVSVTLEDLKSHSQTAVSKIFQTLSTAIEELETAVEDASSHLSRGKRVDDTRRVLANTLKVASSKLGEVVSKADDLSVSIEPSRRKSLVLVQDFIHNLKVAIEQSTRVIDCDKGTAIDRSRDTLIAIEQLGSAMLSFHDQLKSVEEFTSLSGGPQGMLAMKEQVDKLQQNVEKALKTTVTDKNEKMILETIENDVKSVQRVLENLLSEDAADGARVRFILAKAESIHSDLKDLAKATDAPTLKTASQAALAVIDIGGSIMNRKSPMRMEIITQVDPEPEVSVIGELLETMDELDRTFNKLKREAKIRGGDVEVAEMAMEIATLQALIQDVATEASGELLDKAVEVCLPIKTIEVKLSQAAAISPSDIEETSIALHNINQVLNSSIRKKEAEKLMQPSTSIIGELLETVGDLETCFDRLKRSSLPNDTTESEVNDIGREILALQNIVDDLTTGATGELLDRAQEICIPIKSIESTLKHHSVLDKKSVGEVKDKLKRINEELVKAIAQNEADKQKREKEFEKLFSSDSLSSSVDIPIVRSIVTTIEYMQAHLSTLIVPPEMVMMKFFLEKFECSLVQYGERLANGKGQNELNECFSKIEETLKSADTTRIEVRKLIKAVENMKLSKGEMPKALAALQSVLSPLKTLHEELSRPNSPKRIKKAELSYLESFSKSSTDLEVGLMKLEKAATSGTKLEVESMAVPVQQLALLVEGISHEPTLRNLDEESSVHALRSLAQPINAVQTIVTQIQESVVIKDEKKLSELLAAVAKPVRELRTNIALIQDQAMSHCNISQLDELKQAVALMTQVGTETPALKQPLLQLQARLQELEPEAELGEVVSDLTGPVDALKNAVVALETKGENSILLELCHQVVDIIHRSDDTLSEMSSIGPQSTRAEASPGEGLLLKAAKVCHELLDDSSYSELSHTEDTLTPTHAAEHLPSIHGAATAEQRVMLETVESMKDVSISVQEAAANIGSTAGQVKAAVVEHEIGEDQTLSELSEMGNSASATIAAEKLGSIREKVLGEQKIALEEAASLNRSLLTPTEAQAKGVPKEHLQIATVEHNILEDHTLSDISPNDASNSGTLPLEKLTSLKGTVAVEEKQAYEEAHSLDQQSLLSMKEAAVEQTSLSGKIKAAMVGVEAAEEPSLSALSQSEVSVAACSPKLAGSNEAAVAEDHLAWEHAKDLSDAQSSEQEASIKDASERQSAQVKATDIQTGPSELSIVEALLTEGITSVGDLKNIIIAFNKVPQLPQEVKEQFQSFVAKIQNVEPTVKLDIMLGKLYKDVTEFDDAVLKLVKESTTETSEICCKIVEAVKKREEELLKSVDLKVIETKSLLQGDDQDLGKLQKAVAVLDELPEVRELSEKDLRNAVLALRSRIDDLSPSAGPEEILQETLEPKKQLERIVNKMEKGSAILTLCREIVSYIDHGKDIIQQEASALLCDESCDAVKFKRAVTLLSAIPVDEQKATVLLLNQPILALKAKLEELGSLAKPEDVLVQTAEPIKQLKAVITEVECTAGERPKILEAAKLLVGSVERSEQHLQEEAIGLLKADKGMASIGKAVAVLISVSQSAPQKLGVIQAPLQALKAKLEQLGPLAKQEEIIQESFEAIDALKQTVLDLKQTGEKSKSLEICDIVIMKTEEGVQKMQKEVVEMLKGEQSVATLKKAVAKLVEIPMEKSQKAKANQPLLALQAKLESMNTNADAIDILRETLEPIKALKQVVSDIPKAGGKSQVAELCDLIVHSAEKGKEVMEKEAAKLLKGEKEVKKFQRAIALLIDVPKDEPKFSRVNEPLVALQAQLGLLGPSAKPEEIIRVTMEPAKNLKLAISEIKAKSETAGLLEACQLVVDLAEEGKKAMKKDVEQLLKGEQNLATLKKAVAKLIDIPKDEGEKLQEITLPLKALQAKLEDVGLKAEPSEILRKTIEPIRVLKQVVTDLNKAGETSQLLNICELVIEKAESGKEAMQKEAEKLLLEETQNASKLQKAVALLIDIPKEEVHLSKVNEPLVALKAELDKVGPSAKPEEILKCTAEPIKALKQAVSTVGKTEKAQLLQLCELVVQSAEKGKEVVQREVAKILRGEVQSAGILTKAVALLVQLPLEEGQKIGQISKPLTSLKATLETMKPGADRVEIVRGTMEPVKALKKVVQDLKKAGEKSELVEICQLVIEKAEQGKAIMQEEASNLLKPELGDASKLIKAVALLVEVPKDESSKISAIVKPLSSLQAELGTLKASPSCQEILKCTMEPALKLKQVISDVRKTGEKSQLLDVSCLLLEKFEECQESAQREAKELLVGETSDISKLAKAVSIVADVSQMKEEKAVVEPLLALEAKLKGLTPQCKPEELIRGTIEPLKALKQQMMQLKDKEKSTLFEICETVMKKIELGKESMQHEAAQLVVGELKDVVKLKKAVALLVDVPKEGDVAKISAPLVALQATLDKLPSTAHPEEIYRCSAEQIQAVQQVITKVDSKGENAALVDICKSVVTHVESGKEKEKTLKDVELMISAGIRTISQLAEATKVLNKFSGTCESLTKPMEELESRLSFLHGPSNVEDFEADLLGPVKVVKKIMVQLKEQPIAQNEFMETTAALIDHLEPVFHINELLEKERQAKEKKEREEKEKKFKEQQEKELKAKQEKEAKDKELKLKEEKLKLECEKKEKEEQERKAKQELEEKELQKKKEQERKAKQELEEQELQKKKEQERKAKQELEEQELQKKKEQERKAKQELEEQELQKKKEQERKAKQELEEQELLKKKEQERKAKQELEEQELEKKKEQERNAKQELEEQELQKRKEQERKAKQELEEQELQKKKEQEKLEKETELLKEQAAKERNLIQEKEEKELKLKEEQQKLECEKQKKEEQDKKAKQELEEKELQRKKEQDKLGKEKKEWEEKEKHEQELKLKTDKEEQGKKKIEEEKEKQEKENKLKDQQKQPTEKKRKSIKEGSKKDKELRVEESKEEKKGEPKAETKDAQKLVELVVDEEKAEKDKAEREKQQSLSYVEASITKGIKSIAELKAVVRIMRLYKQVCLGLAEPLDALGLVLENLYEKSQVNDFTMDLVQPVLKLKKATDSVKSQESGLLTVTIMLLEHLEPVLGWKEVEKKEKQRDEREKMKLQKQQEEEQAKADKIKEEELEKERIDAEMRKGKAQAEKERDEEEAKKKELREKAQAEKQKVEEEEQKKLLKEKVLAEMEKEKQAEEAKKKLVEEKASAGEEMIVEEKKKPQEEKMQVQKAKAETEAKKKELEVEPEQQQLVTTEEVKKGPEAIETSRLREQKRASRKEDKATEIVEEKRIRSQKALEEVERRDAELKLARENERKSREEKLLLMQQERDKEEEEMKIRREKERVEKESKALEERRKLEKEKEEVEQREKSIKAKLEQVKREKRELEMEEQNKMLQARKMEKERQEKEEIVRKEMEEAKVKQQQEREMEMKKQRLKELERREAELDNIRSRESLRMAHLDDLHKREIAKGISKSLDAVPIYSSFEKVNRGPMEYSSSVTTMSSVRDTGVHSSRGISVVELMDYEPPPVRPERTKKSSDFRIPLEFNREAHVSKWDGRLRELSPDIRRRPQESAYTPPTSRTDVSAYQWDKSREQSWKHLEYPTPEYDPPSAYHRSRRSISPMRDYGSTQSLTRYQPAPQQVSYQHRSRRSLSPLERSLQQPYSGSTASLTSLGSRKHLDELTSARVRPPTPTRSYVPGRSRSITKNDHRAFIVNGLVDKTVIHGGKIRLSCNIGGDPNPSIEWMKDGKGIAYHTEALRYKTECNYGVACLEVEGARLSDAGQYTCVVKNVDGQSATTCTVRVALNDDDEKEYESIENELEANMPREVCLSIKGSAFGMPRVTGLVADPVVPSGGTIAVHVQVAGCKRPEVTWFREGAPLPKYSPRVHYFEDGGLFTLLLEGATPAESGVYTCRVAGRGRGAVDTMTTVQVVERHGHEKPAIFTAKPDTRMTLAAGEDMTLACYVGGEPRPQVTLMKGIKDITTSCRTLKETFGEYVRLTLKRVTLEDRGTFFIMAKNIYGTDRTFVTLDVRERARSVTPPSWSERTVSLTSLFKEVHHSSPSWRSASNLHSSYSSLLE